MNATAAPESVVLENSTGNRLVFHWTADRYEHRMVTSGGVAESLCSNTDSSWPTSPPLQQLSKESINGQDVVLGVGCAGTSHWSVSVEPRDDGFQFDWACKTKEPPEHLGSRYSIQHPVSVLAGTHGDVSVLDDGAEIVPTEQLGDAKTYRWSYRIVAST